jgi:hypothetical protein
MFPPVLDKPVEVVDVDSTPSSSASPDMDSQTQAPEVLPLIQAHFKQVATFPGFNADADPDELHLDECIFCPGEKFVDLDEVGQCIWCGCLAHKHCLECAPYCSASCKVIIFSFR